MTRESDSDTEGPEAPKSPALDSGQTVGSHYIVEAPVHGPSGSFFGRDTEGGDAVVLIPVSAEHAEKLSPATSVEHPHLGRLLDVVTNPGGEKLAVAARVSGQTLEERLRVIGKKAPVDAVRMALRIADALNALHAVGAVHGFVHAGSVVVDPEGEPPVLAFYPSEEGEPLHAPERTQGSAPSVADDAWAAAGLLYWMLTGSPPKAGGYAKPEALGEGGMADAQLRSALWPTLAADPTERQTNLRPLRRELARWFVEHAGEEPIPEGAHSKAPPPLPHSVRPPSSLRPGAMSTMAPAAPRGRRLVLFAAAAIGLGLLAGSVASFLRPKRVELVSVPKAGPKAPPRASAVKVGDVAMAAAFNQLR